MNLNLLDKKNTINYLRILFSFSFLLSFPFSSAINNISYGLLMATSIFILFKNKQTIKISRLGYISIFVVLLLILDILFLGNISKDYNTIFRYLILLTSPLLFYGDKHSNFQFKKIYLISYGVFFLIAVFDIFNHFLEFNNFSFYKGVVKVKDAFFFERLYFGLFSVLAAIISSDIFKNKYLKKYTVLLLILLINFIIATRLAFLIVFAILISQAIIDAKRISLKKTFISGAILLIVFIGLISINEGFRSRFLLNSKSYDEFVLKFKINEPRYAIWKCAFLISTDNPEFNKLTGFSSNDQLFKNLFGCYEKHVYIEAKRNWFLRDKLNTHNQFIHFYLLHGIVGLSFIVLLIFSFLLYNHNVLSLYLLLSIVLFCTIESFIFRQIGVYLISVSLYLLLNNRQHNL